MHADEEPILKRCRSGDLDAFGELVERYEDRVRRTAFLLVGNRDDAQDVAQETFVRAFKSLSSFRHECAFSTWLHRITLNAARNWLRENRRRAQMSDLEWEAEMAPAKLDEATPEHQVLRREGARRLQAALQTLPDRYREALVLKVYHDLPYSDIAEILQVPVGTVRSRLAKARELVVKRLRWDAFLDRSKEAGAK